MANQARFRTAIFGGYNCSDVIDFIKEESKRNRQELAQKDARIAELEEKFAASARDLAEERRRRAPISRRPCASRRRSWTVFSRRTPR